MNPIVIYKSKYGSTKQYAEWIADELNCLAVDAKKLKVGGGLYAEIIAGVTLITKNMDLLADKKIVIFTTGLTPIDCREYYDGLIIEKNFKGDTYSKIKMFNYPGKMILSELSVVHRTAVKTLKKVMQDKKNPTDMEKLLINLCDADGDFSDRTLIKDLIEFVKAD